MRTQFTGIVLVLVVVTLAGSQDRVWRDRAMAPYNAGLHHMAAEEFEEAVRSFRQAIDADSTFELAHYMLGRVHLMQKKFPEAAAALIRARDLYRADAGKQFSTAQDAQLVRRDRIAEIDDAIRQLQGRPQTNAVQNQLRQLNDYKRQMQDALQRGDGSMSVKQSVPAFVSLSLGSAYFRMGRLAEAEKAYGECLDADPKSGEAHNNLAVVYLESGRYAEAERAVRAAEKAGMRVHPNLKADIAKKLKDR